MIVGSERTHDRLTGVVVVPDGGGHREDPLEHADGHASGGAAAVALQVELSLEGLVDRLDDLPHRSEQPRSGPLSLALVGRTQQVEAQLRQLRLELAAEVVLVADQCLPGRSAASAGSVARMSSRVSRSSAFAPVSAKAIGSPPRVHTRCSRSPQT